MSKDAHAPEADWEREATEAIGKSNLQRGRRELAEGIAVHVYQSARSGASGPFAFWTREQVLGMSCTELASVLLPLVDQEAIRMHLAGCFIEQLRKQLRKRSFEYVHTRSHQLQWTIRWFEHVDASPDYSFVAPTYNDAESAEWHLYRLERPAYCEVLLANILWQHDRERAA